MDLSVFIQISYLLLKINQKDQHDLFIVLKS